MYPFLELCCYNKIAKILYEKLIKESSDLTCCNCYRPINEKFKLLTEQDTINGKHSILQISSESRLIILQLIRHQLRLNNKKIFHECESYIMLTKEINDSRNLWLRILNASLEDKIKIKEINIMLNALEVTFLRYENPESWERERQRFCAKFPNLDSVYNECKRVHWHILRNEDYGTSTLYSLLVQLLSFNL
jgi:hypothetical protein